MYINDERKLTVNNCRCLHCLHHETSRATCWFFVLCRLPWVSWTLPCKPYSSTLLVTDCSITPISHDFATWHRMSKHARSPHSVMTLQHPILEDRVNPISHDFAAQHCLSYTAGSCHLVMILQLNVASPRLQGHLTQTWLCGTPFCRQTLNVIRIHIRCACFCGSEFQTVAILLFTAVWYADVQLVTCMFNQ